jgi:hypothetical protein
VVAPHAFDDLVQLVRVCGEGNLVGDVVDQHAGLPGEEDQVA